MNFIGLRCRPEEALGALFLRFYKFMDWQTFLQNMFLFHLHYRTGTVGRTSPR